MAAVELGLKQQGSLAMTPSLRQAIGFLALSNAELSVRLADLQKSNMALSVSPRSARELSLGQMRQVPPPDSAQGSWMPAQGGPGGLDTSLIASAAPGLVAHVQMQLPLLVRRLADRPVADAILRHLAPSGWLGASLDEISAETGYSVGTLAPVLAQLQRAEPTGLFAQSLSDCLFLQLEEQGHMTPAFTALLKNLPLVAAGNSAALAEACGCDETEVVEMIRRLRRLDPKPGAAFDQSGGAPRTVDLVLHRDGTGWLLELNAESMPALKIDGGRDTSAEAQREARMVVQALERRHATVLSIATEIVMRQDAHLRGRGPLAALTINDLAAATGLHRSSVSRVTAALTMATPGRTVGLRDMMSAAAPAARRLEDPLSVSAVLLRMKQIVSTENPEHPLSDDALSRLLLPEGAALARRTVAKYRRLADIPARSERRRKA